MILSRDEIGRLYEGRIVLVRVTEIDSSGFSSAGEVLGVWDEGPESDEAVGKAFAAAGRGPKPLPGPYYLFHAGPRIRSGPEFDRAMSELIQEIREVVGSRSASRD